MIYIRGRGVSYGADLNKYLVITSLASLTKSSNELWMFFTNAGSFFAICFKESEYFGGPTLFVNSGFSI